MIYHINALYHYHIRPSYAITIIYYDLLVIPSSWECLCLSSQLTLGFSADVTRCG